MYMHQIQIKDSIHPFSDLFRALWDVSTWGFMTFCENHTLSEAIKVCQILIVKILKERDDDQGKNGSVSD